MNSAVILPAYNEEISIREMIVNFHHQLPDASIWVIDNNSTDKTHEISSDTIRELGCGGGVLFERQQGKSNAIRKAFRCIEADIYVICDADSTYLPEDLPTLLDPVLRGEADMAVGDRLSCGDYDRTAKRRFHHFGNRLVCTLINFFFKVTLHDVLSGFRVMNRRFVKLFPILSKKFELETEITLHAIDKNYTIHEAPISYRSRVKGSVSKLNTFQDGIKIIKIIFLLFRIYKPYKFFSFISLFCTVSGLIIGTPVIYEFIKYRYIYRVPSAILATGLIIIAVILFSIGIILESIANVQRFQYELEILNYDKKK